MRKDMAELRADSSVLTRVPLGWLLGPRLLIGQQEAISIKST